MTEKFQVDPLVAPYYDVTLILCAMVFCAHCQSEIEYTSTHAAYTDANYYDAAVAMRDQGWIVRPKSLDALCPSCAVDCDLEA